jgi:hypothetical protein
LTEGLTNKEIGARLFISERTVESHVRNILNKIGFTSRAQIAGWMATSDRQCSAAGTVSACSSCAEATSTRPPASAHPQPRPEVRPPRLPP